MKKTRKKPSDLRLGDCSVWGDRIQVGYQGSEAQCRVPLLTFSGDSDMHISRMRRLADWLVEAAMWLEKEAGQDR